MNKNYFLELKRVAPKFIKEFCEIYQYYEHENEYYSKYLLDATNIDCGFNTHGMMITHLQNEFDGSLEPFKLDVMLIISHLEANKYKFSFTPKFVSETNEFIYLINVYKIENSSFTEIIHGNIPKRKLENVMFDACIIAAKDLEQSLH